MNKLLTKIVGATLGLAMAIGVGVGVANTKTKPVVAAEGDTHSFTDIAFSTQLNNNASVDSVSISQQSYTVKTISANVRYNKTVGGVTITPTIGSTVLESKTHNANSTVDLTWTVNPAVQGGITFDFVNNCGSGTGKGTFYFNSVTLTEGPSSGGGDPTPTTYTVTYNANGATSGSVPTDSNTYSSGDTVTVLGNSGNLEKTNYTWSGWNTATDGTGDNYTENDTFDITENTTLYAKWIADPTYSVVYHDTNSTGGSVPTDDASYFAGAAITVLGNTNSLVRDGFVWSGWSLNPNGAGLAYGPTYISKYTIGSANVDFYPVWLPLYSNELAFHFAGSTVQDSQSYAARSATVETQTASKYNSATWQITVGNNSAELGTNGKATNLSKSTLGEGGFDAAPGLASALGITTTETKYSAAICTTPMTDVYEIDLLFTGNNGGNPATAWVLSSTDGTAWEIEAEKTANIVTESKFTFFKNADARQYAFVAHWTSDYSGGLKGFELKMFGDFQTITADSDSAYIDQTITLTTSASTANWSIVANTAGATLSVNSGKTTIVSAQQAGSVTVQAAADGFGFATKTITFSVRPVSPFVLLDEDSANGYTGQNTTIGFSYGNLNSSLGVAAENSNVNASLQNDDGDSAEVLITFMHAGSCEVYVKDGSSVLATITVSVTESVVSITGMPSSKTMGNGSSLNLGGLVDISATGSFTNAVTWSSSADDVATVNDSGVVTAFKPGSTVITVTPVNYPSGAVSCTITVVNDKAILAKSIVSGDTVFLGCQAASVQYNGPSSTSTVYGLGASFVGAPNIDGLALEVENGSAENSFAFRIKTGTYADYYLTWIEENSLNISDTIDNNSSWNVSFDDDGNATIANVATEARKIWWNNSSPRFACYTNKGSNKDVQLWKLANPENYINKASVVETIHGHENYTADVLTSVDSVAIRFGATVAKDNWDAIKASWTITDYGVMLMAKSDLDNTEFTTVQQAFDNNASSSILKIVNKRAGGAEYEDPYLDGNDYLFTVKVNFPNDSSYYDDVIYAVPFIVVSGQYYFFNEMHTSVQELALDYYGTGNSSLSDAALEMLVGA